MKIEVVSETTVEEEAEAVTKGDFASPLSSLDPSSIQQQQRQQQRDSSSVTSKAVQALVQHYRQSVHFEGEKDGEAAPDFLHNDDSDDTNLSPVLRFWRDQILQHHATTNNGKNDDDNDDESADEGVLIIHQRLVMASLLSEYLQHIRPLFPIPGGHPSSVSSDTEADEASSVDQAMSVLLHFERLVSSCRPRKEQARHGDTFASLPSLDTTSNTTTATTCDELMQILCSDVTLLIPKALELKSQVEMAVDHQNNNNKTSGSTENVPEELEEAMSPELMAQRWRHYQCLTRRMIPTLLRLMHHVLDGACFGSLPSSSSSTDGDARFRVSQVVQAQVAVTLLAFGYEGDTIVGPRTVFPPSVDRIQNVQQYLGNNGVEKRPPSDGVDCRSVINKTTTTQHMTHQMVWSDVELSSEEWDTGGYGSKTTCVIWKDLVSLSQQGAKEDWNKPDSSMRTYQEELVSASHIETTKDQEDWWLQLSRAARARFFGRDLVTTAISQTSMLAVVPRSAPTQTRLHLARTVTEEKPQHEKPYQEIPSRVVAVARLISLLPSAKFGAATLDEWWPIVYELLNSNQERLSAIGAMFLCRLLHAWNGTGISQLAPIVVDNLHTMLTNAVRTYRGGPTLALLGVAQQELYARFPDHPSPVERQQRQVKSLRQWLTILHQNHTLRLATSWGCLIGGVLPLFQSLSTQQLTQRQSSFSTDDDIVARLGLQALLPLVQMENRSTETDEGAMFASPYTSEVQWLAILAFFNWLALVPAATPRRHGGKIMSAFLACLGDGPLDERVQLWAKDISVHAYQASGEYGKQLVLYVTESEGDEEFQSDFVAIAKSIESQAMKQAC